MLDALRNLWSTKRSDSILDAVRKIREQLEMSRIQDVPTLCQEFANICCKVLDCQLSSVWSVDPVRRRLVHVASSGEERSKLEAFVLEPHDCASADTLSQKRCRTIPLNESDFRHPRYAHANGLALMESVPVLNIGNENQVTYIVNFCFVDPEPRFDKSVYASLGYLFASYYEEMLLERCFRESNLLTITLGKYVYESLSVVSKLLAKSVLKAMDADLVGVFFKRESKIELLGWTISTLHDLQANEDLAMSLVRGSLDSNREQLMFKESGSTPSGAKLPMGGIAVPLKGLTGESVGSIVCARFPRLESSLPLSLNYDDIAVLQTMAAAFEPYYEMHETEVHRLATLGRVGHEINGPITGINGAVTFLARDLKSQDISLGEDYIDDLRCYAKTINEIANDFELGVAESIELDLGDDRTRLVNHIFAPTMRAIEATLSSRGFSKGKITRPNLHIAPPLWLDRPLMLRVVFNLFENAIKYAKKEASKFEVLVEYSWDNDSELHKIFVRDNGIGIPDGFEERIFVQGVRAPNALRDNVTGLGLGLPIARKILRAHGGDLRCVPQADGACFELSFPAFLGSKQKPQIDKVREFGAQT